MSNNKGPSSNAKSEREKKLFELRLQVNKLRKENTQLVYEEDRKSKEPSNADAKREREQYYAEKEQEKEQLLEMGIDPEKEKLLNTTASEAEWRDKKRRKSENSGTSFGWDQYNSEAQYKAYKKRVKASGFTKEEYEKQKSTQPEEEFYPTTENLVLGRAPEPTPEQVNRMVTELNNTVSKRKNFSRKRGEFEEAYVDYISDRNKAFNQKIAKAFDPYTQEIKQNLERGTAV